jgi:hypothetical protein
MTGHRYDRTGERIEDDDRPLVLISNVSLDLTGEEVTRSPDEIVAHCEELRAVIRDTRAWINAETTHKGGAVHHVLAEVVRFFRSQPPL